MKNSNTSDQTKKILLDIQNKLDELEKLDPETLLTFLKAYQINDNCVIQLSDIINKRIEAREIKPLPLDVELLLKRIAEGGFSGTFLAGVFLSTYKPGRPFFQCLFDIDSLDSVEVRLFNQILKIHISGTNPIDLYRIEKQIFTRGDCSKKQA